MDLSSALQFMNLSYDINISNLKEKYKNLARKLHPDKLNGNVELFQSLQQAYNIILGYCNKGGRQYILVTPDLQAFLLQWETCKSCKEHRQSSNWCFCVNCNGVGCDVCVNNGGFYSNGFICKQCNNSCKIRIIQHFDKSLLPKNIENHEVINILGTYYTICMEIFENITYKILNNHTYIELNITLENILLGISIKTKYFSINTKGAFDPSKPIQLNENITVLFKFKGVENIDNIRKYQKAFNMMFSSGIKKNICS
jgi:hypothetical protein